MAPTGSPYTDTKIASEHLVVAAHAAGRVRAVVVRPGDVYGPRSQPWTVRPVQQLRTGRFALVDGDRGVLSPVHVDDVARGAVLAASSDAALGHVLHLSSDGGVPPRAFFGHYARMLGVPLRSVPPRVAALAAPVVGAAFSALRREPPMSSRTLEYMTHPGAYSIAAAGELLGWRPEIDLDTGMVGTEAWLREQGTPRAVTAPPRPVGRPARHTPEELLALVVEQFNARGYDATSMEDLARATGMTKSSLYHHASGKSELLRRGVDRALDALFAVLDEPVDGSAADRLEHVLRRSVAVLVEQLPYVTLLLRVRGNTAVERAALARRRAFDGRLTSLVRDAVDAGELRDDLDPRLVTRLLFGAVNSIAEWYRPGRGLSAEAVSDALARLALDGLRPRA